MAEIRGVSFEAQVDNALQVVSGPVAAALWEFDANRAESALTGLREAPFYWFSRVVTGGAVFVRHHTDDRWRVEWDAALNETTADSVRNVAPSRRRQGALLLISQPLEFEGRRVGVLELAFNTAPMAAERRAEMVRAIAKGLGAAALMAIVIAVLLSRLLAPLVDLADAVRRFSRGAPIDVSEHRERRDEIGDVARAIEMMRASHDEARTDALTGLPNRRALDDVLAAQSEAGPYALLLVDIDDFKPINDNFGHNGGDHALKAIAERLQARLDGRGEVLRMGGDEFAAVLPGVAERDVALVLADGLAEAVCAPIEIAGESAYVGASIGVALSSDVGADPSSLLSAADAAMYSVKQSTTERVAMYDTAASRRRFSVKEWRELEIAFAEKQIETWFQPQVCLATRRLIGFEALARWRHPEKGMLTPGAFLPMVEDLRRQRQFDLLMVRSALETLADWRQAGAPACQMSINLTEQTLALKDGAADLLALLTEFEDLRGSITLEITEDVFIARSADAIQRTLEKLFEFGVRLSMDDFGTGYGSFRHLQEYEFHELKIDRRFVSLIGKDASSEVLIKGFVSIAQGLGADIVAEGVETQEQMEFLRDLNCQFGQGYLFGRPMPAADAAAQIAGAA